MTANMPLGMSLQEACWELCQHSPVLHKASPVEQGPARQGWRGSGGQRPGSTVSSSRQTRVGSSTDKENRSAWCQQQGRGSQACPEVQPAVEVIPAWSAQAPAAQGEAEHNRKAFRPCPLPLPTTAARCTLSPLLVWEVWLTLGSSHRHLTDTTFADKKAVRTTCQVTWTGGRALWLLVHILHWPSPSLGLLQPGCLCPATPRQLIQSPTPMTPRLTLGNRRK